MYSGKALPKPTLETKPFWEACQNHELKIQKCPKCESYQFYPRDICTNCMSDEVEWVNTAGTGKVVTFTIIRRAPNKAYAADLPYVLALIELDEGPVFMSNIIHCDPESVEIGMEVEVTFEDWTEEISVPQFVLKNN